MQDAIWSISGVVTTDLNEGENRIEIGIEDLGLAKTIEQPLTALAIPVEAVVFQQREQLTIATHPLRDPAPGGILEGGYQISRSGSQVCTLGCNAQRAGFDGLVTAGHCTDNLGEVNDTLFFQPSSAVNPDDVGIEVSDPPLRLQSSGLPLGKGMPLF